MENACGARAGGRRGGRRATFAVPPSALVPRLRYASELGLLAVVLVWGVNFAVIKVPLEVAPPFTVNLLRFVVSVVVLGAFHARDARRRGVAPWAAFAVGPWRVVGLGLLGILVYQVGFILGIARVSSGMGALLIATSPAWTAVTAHVLRLERLLTLGWVGFGVSLAGVALVVAGNPNHGFGGQASGVALMLAASLAWGLYTTLSRPLLSRGASPLGLTFWGIVVSFPGLFALAAPELGSVDWGRFDAAVVWALLFSGGLSTGLAYAIWNASVLKVGSSRTAAVSNLVPFIGVVAGVVLQGDRVTALQVVGGALIVAGVVVVRRRGIGPVEAATAPAPPAPDVPPVSTPPAGVASGAVR